MGGKYARYVNRQQNVYINKINYSLYNCLLEEKIKQVLGIYVLQHNRAVVDIKKIRGVQFCQKIQKKNKDISEF